MCPIESPEGPNIGLIGSLSTYARVNEYGFIETPYRVMDKSKGQWTGEVRYMTAEEEDKYTIAQANEPLDENNCLINSRITCRVRDKFVEVSPDRVDMMDVSPRQLVSVATGMIPFLENDDANRALHGFKHAEVGSSALDTGGSNSSERELNIRRRMTLAFWSSPSMMASQRASRLTG